MTEEANVELFRTSLRLYNEARYRQVFSSGKMQLHRNRVLTELMKAVILPDVDIDVNYRRNILQFDNRADTILYYLGLMFAANLEVDLDIVQGAILAHVNIPTLFAQPIGIVESPTMYLYALLLTIQYNLSLVENPLSVDEKAKLQPLKQ